MKRTVLIPFLIVVASACAGPRTPVPIGVKEFPTDILLGVKADNLEPLERSPIETNPIVVSPRRPLSPAAPTLPPATADPCPQADPLSAPKLEAVNRTSIPPVERSYAFRTTGFVVIDGKRSDLPVDALRTIQKVERTGDHSFTFEVLDELGSLKTLNRYEVIERGDLEPTVTPGGIFITETVRGDGNDEPVTYTWDPPIQLIKFPAAAGVSWQVKSTALEGQVVMSFSAQIGVTQATDDPLNNEIKDPKSRVDACGSYIDAWNVQWGTPDPSGSSSGHYVSPDLVLNFSDSYAVATQYGGIVVGEDRSAMGSSGSQSVQSERESTINVVPASPKR